MRLLLPLLALLCPAAPLAAQEAVGFHAPAYALALWLEDSRATYGTRLPMLARPPAPAPATLGFPVQRFELARFTSFAPIVGPSDPIVLESRQSPRFATGAVFADLTVTAMPVLPLLPIYVNPLVRPFAAHDSVRDAIRPPRRRTGVMMGGLGLRMTPEPEGGWDTDFAVNGGAGVLLRMTEGE